jgi:hypothetical protein
VSKTKKWMLGLVPLLLVAAPVLADEAAETQSQQAVPIPARADEDRSQEADAQRVEALEVLVKELQAELASASSFDVRPYLDQDDPLLP